MTRNGVLGGGALGLTVALRLLQRGENVVLVEREPEPGGLAAGFRLGPSYLEKFYHHLFRSDTQAVALIGELGLGDRLVWPRPRTSTLVGGRPYQLDSPLTLLRFSPLPFLDRLRLGAALAYLRVEPNYRRLEHTTADAWIRRWMGSRVYETVWSPLLRSKFGDRHAEIAMSWFWARVHLRSASLGYLQGGFQQLYNRLVEEIERLGGEVRFGTEVTRITRGERGTLCVGTSAGTHEVDRVVSTLPTRLTINLTPDLQGDFADRYGRLDSYGAHCVILCLDRPLTDIYWLNINDPGYPFLALVEHTNYMPPQDYGGRHVMYLGNYLPMNHPLFTMKDDEVLAAFLPALARINPRFDPSWVAEHYIFKAPFAQPIVTVGYPDRLPPHRTPVPNLYLANMSQVYPQDRGQNYSIAMANRLVSALPSQTSL
ncbi:MAG: NAD(P)/FAD-dependent oxidoreductase [Chloroflexi bacterium]|nr:NAD(P)/FAD-dependent oxidoreductase [Chloroflexota bacterium]